MGFDKKFLVATSTSGFFVHPFVFCIESLNIKGFSGFPYWASLDLSFSRMVIFLGYVSACAKFQLSS